MDVTSLWQSWQHEHQSAVAALSSVDSIRTYLQSFDKSARIRAANDKIPSAIGVQLFNHVDGSLLLAALMTYVGIAKPIIVHTTAQLAKGTAEDRAVAHEWVDLFARVRSEEALLEELVLADPITAEEVRRAGLLRKSIHETVLDLDRGLAAVYGEELAGVAYRSWALLEKVGR